MKKTKRTIRTTEITVETQQFLVVSKSRSSLLAWCPGCLGEVRMALPEVAAVMSGLSTRELYRRIETGAVHFVEAPNHALVCLGSLYLNQSTCRSTQKES